MALPCLAHLLVLLPFLCTVIVCSSPTHHKQEKVLCIEEERQALLTFKDGLRSSNSLLESSWVGGDCCNWMGVGCNNTTGHVIRLDLRSASIDVSNDNESGELNTSLLELNHLEYLDLSNNSFGSKLIPKFFGSFKKLTYLNLSCALFHGAVPSQLGNLSRLQSLDLSSHPSLLNCWNFNILNVNDFRWVSHLSSLKYLYMSGVDLSGAHNWLQVTNLLPSLSTLSLSSCFMENLPVLTHPNFTALTHLDLSFNQIASKFPSWLVNLTHLQYLDLIANSFEGPIPSSIGCLCNLQVLALTGNKMEGEVSGFLESLSKCCSADLDKDGRSSSIRELNLGWNNFSGTVPESVGQLLGLEQLYLSSNNFSGTVPESVGQLLGLELLALSSNNFSGTVPESIGQLSELEWLDLSYNSLEGVIYEAHFANLTRLKGLGVSNNSLVFNVSQDWIPPPKLESIELGSCRLGPKFPRWLRFLKDYTYIDLSNNQISDAMPTWFWNLSSKATSIDLSSNNISGKIPISSELYTGRVIDLSSNRFEGFLPYHVSNAHIMNDVYYSDTVLVARDNFLNGSIPLSFCDIKSLSLLDLSNNQITGKIPSCFGNFSNLYYVDLSNNSLDGEIPSFRDNNSALGVLDLENNHLTGQMPSSIAKLERLSILNLSNNSLVGTIPKRFESSYLESLSLSHNQLHGVHPLSFANDFSSESNIPLIALDLSKNSLSGSLTTWMWENLTQLRFLNLRSNMFHGNIPPQLSLLTSLQVLDLSDNNLSGVIPSSFSNFTAMSRIHDPSEELDYLEPRYAGGTSNFLELSVIMKGNELEYTKTIGLLNTIDLSRNGLSGEIPKGLVRLTGLKSLNLSRNQLEGSIPKDIGNLQELESLDFSRNHLSGTIPWSISTLDSLSCLNLSYNNLSGHIPSGRQLQTLIDPSIYTGNYNLCGPPLSECPDGPSPTSLTFNGGDEEDRSKLLWFSMGAMMGFVIGFWAICGILILNKSWRISYYGFFDRLIARLSLLVVNIILKVRK